MIPKMYAFGCPSWQSREGSGVVEDPNGDWWFFWMISSDRNPKPGFHFICEVARVIDSPSQRYNKDGDMIEPRQIRSFMYEYRSRVKNPDAYDLYSW